MISPRIGPLSDALTESRERVSLNDEAEYPVAGVYGFGRGVLLREPVRGRDIAAEALYRIRRGQIIYSRLKAFEGAFALVPLEADGRFVSNEFPTFDVNDEVADPRFIALLLRSRRIWTELSELITGIGARRERLQVDEFLSYEVPLPDLSDQREAVSRADAFAVLAVRQASEAASVRRLAGAALQDALKDGQGRVIPLSEFARLDLHKVEVSPEAEYPTAGVRIAGGGLFRRELVSGAETTYTKLTQLHSGQLVYRKLTAWEGPITVVPAAFDGYFVSPEFPTFSLDRSQIDLDVMRLVCRSPAFHLEMKSLATGTAERRNRLKPEDLLQIEVELPEPVKQKPVARLCRLADALETEANAAQDLSRVVGASIVRELLQT